MFNQIFLLPHRATPTRTRAKASVPQAPITDKSPRWLPAPRLLPDAHAPCRQVGIIRDDDQIRFCHIIKTHQRLTDSPLRFMKVSGFASSKPFLPP